jgi:hypothetical protein
MCYSNNKKYQKKHRYMNYRLLLCCSLLFSAKMLFSMEESESNLTTKIHKNPLHTIIEDEDFYISVSKTLFNKENPEKIVTKLKDELTQLIDYRNNNTNNTALPTIKYLTKYYQLRYSNNQAVNTNEIIKDMQKNLLNTENENFCTGFLALIKNDIEFLKNNIRLVSQFVAFHEKYIENKTLSDVINNFAQLLVVNTKPHNHDHRNLAMYYKTYINKKITTLVTIKDLYNLLDEIKSDYLKIFYNFHSPENSIFCETICHNWCLNLSICNDFITDYIKKPTSYKTNIFNTLEQIIPVLKYFHESYYEYNNEQVIAELLKQPPASIASVIFFMLSNNNVKNEIAEITIPEKQVEIINKIIKQLIDCDQDKIKNVIQQLRQLTKKIIAEKRKKRNEINDNTITTKAKEVILVDIFQKIFLETEYAEKKNTSKWPPLVMKENIITIHQNFIEGQDEEQREFLERSFQYLKDIIQYKNTSQLLKDKDKYIDILNNLDNKAFIDAFIIENNLYNDQLLYFCNNIKLESFFWLKIEQSRRLLIELILHLWNIEKKSGYALYDKKIFFETLLQQEIVQSNEKLFYSNENGHISISGLNYRENTLNSDTNPEKIPLQKCIFEYIQQEIAKILKLKLSFCKDQQIAAKKVEIYFFVEELKDDNNIDTDQVNQIKLNIVEAINSLSSLSNTTHPMIDNFIKIRENAFIDTYKEFHNRQSTEYRIGFQPLLTVLNYVNTKNNYLLPSVVKKIIDTIANHNTTNNDKITLNKRNTLYLYESIKNVFGSNNTQQKADIVYVIKKFITEAYHAPETYFPIIMDAFFRIKNDEMEDDIITFFKEHPAVLAQYIHTLKNFKITLSFNTISLIHTLIKILYKNSKNEIFIENSYDVTHLSEKLLAPIITISLQSDQNKYRDTQITTILDAYPEILKQYILHNPKVIQNAHNLYLIKYIVHSLHKTINKNYDTGPLSIRLFEARIKLLSENDDENYNTIIDMSGKHPALLAKYLHGLENFKITLSDHSISLINTLIDTLYANSTHDIFKNNQYDLAHLSTKLLEIMIKSNEYNNNPDMQSKIISICDQYPLMLAQYVASNKTIHITIELLPIIDGLIKILDNNATLIQKQYNITDLSKKLLNAIISRFFDQLCKEDGNSIALLIITYCTKYPESLAEYLLNNNIKTISNTHISIIETLIDILYSNQTNATFINNNYNVTNLSSKLFNILIDAYPSSTNSSIHSQIISIFNTHPEIWIEDFLNNQYISLSIEQIPLMYQLIAILDNNSLMKEKYDRTSLSKKLLEKILDAFFTVMPFTTNEIITNQIIAHCNQHPEILEKNVSEYFFNIHIESNKINLVMKLIDILLNNKKAYLSLKLFMPLMQWIFQQEAVDRDERITYYAEKYDRLIIEYARNSYQMRLYQNINDHIKHIITLMTIINKNTTDKPQLATVGRNLFKEITGYFLNYFHNEAMPTYLIDFYTAHPAMLADYILNHHDHYKDRISIKKIILIDILNNNKKFIEPEYDVNTLSIKLLSTMFDRTVYNETDNQINERISWCMDHPLLVAHYIAKDTISCDELNTSYINIITSFIDILNAKKEIIEPTYNVHDLSMKVFTNIINKYFNTTSQYTQTEIIEYCNKNPILLAKYINNNTIEYNNIFYNDYVSNITKLIDILNKNAEFIPKEYDLTALSTKLFTKMINTDSCYKNKDMLKQIVIWCQDHPLILAAYLDNNNFQHDLLLNTRIKLIDILNYKKEIIEP